MTRETQTDELSQSMTNKSPVNSPAWRQILSVLESAWPVHRWQHVGVVVGCSGGADSVGLLCSLVHLAKKQNQDSRGFLVAAHYNHGLRGSESDGDEHFVRDLAQQLNVRFVTSRSSEHAKDEASLRSQRLQFLEQTAQQAGARYISVAHSADDNVETVLHHLMRGTGPAGLAGISQTRPIGSDLVLVRPLLAVPRSLIRQGLREIQQDWREDSSNVDIDYRRNWIRHELIPSMESEFPQVVHAIGRAIEGQAGWRELVDRLATQWLSGNLLGNEETTLRHDPEVDPAVLIAALQQLWDTQGWPRQEMSRQHWLRLVGAIQTDELDRFSLPGGLDVKVAELKVTISLP